MPALKLEGFYEPPFGSFEVLYCEGPDGPPTGDVQAPAPETELRIPCMQHCNTACNAGWALRAPLRMPRTCMQALEPEMEQVCELEGLAGFGSCSSIRVVRTQQGYYSINRRMTPMEGWGDA